MRKYIIPLFLSLCPTMAMAATNDECQQSYINYNQNCISKGCGYYNNKCVACPAGTYQNQPPTLEDLLLGGISGRECNSCTYPWQFDEQSITWTWDKSKTGMESPDDCTINVHIPKGHELIEKQNITQYTVQECADNHYKTEYTTLTYTLTDPSNPYPDIPLPNIGQIPDNAKCKKCGNNATHNDDHTNCNCKDGYYYGDNITNTTNADSNHCELIAYSAKYCAEQNSSDCWNSQTKLTLVYPHKIPTIIDCTDDYIQDIPDATPCFTQKTGYDFTGDWKANRKLLVHSPGGAPKQIESGGTISNGPEVYLTKDSLGDVTFTAVWKAKEFTVNYNTDGQCTQTSHPCTYDSTCTLDFKCDQQNPGEYIAGWQCTYGCSDKEKIYKSGANISNISGGNTMTLTAIWETCDAGYYCNGGTKNACPAGCTSDADSYEIADCYLSGETKFCHDGACFTIPDLKISYSSNSSK